MTRACERERRVTRARALCERQVNPCDELCRRRVRGQIFGEAMFGDIGRFLCEGTASRRVWDDVLDEFGEFWQRVCVFIVV